MNDYRVSCEEVYYEEIEYPHHLTLVRRGIPVRQRRENRKRTWYWVNHPKCQAANKVAISKQELRRRIERIGCSEQYSGRVSTWLWSAMK